uniref:Amino acid permease/ SLC12A domain-containing protein n=1 Tax=Arcella intermedia TaxID=1963864 RepID=A0A6B2LCX9_9EUKA
MMIMTFFWTCGAPFGIESAVGAGGALLVMLVVVFVSFFWALPQAMMSLELSLMIQYNGGNVVWVRRAFGNFVGFVGGHSYLISNFITLSLLTILFVEYLPFPFTDLQKHLVRLALVSTVVSVNIKGTQWVSNISSLLLVIIFCPFLLELLLALTYKTELHFGALLDIPPPSEINWGVLISTTVWAFGSFDSIGAIAGEVKGGKSAFISGVLGSFPLLIANYIIPIVIAYVIDPHWKSWGLLNWALWGCGLSGVSCLAWTLADFGVCDC